MNDNYIIQKVNELKEQYYTADPLQLLEELGVGIKYSYDFVKLKAFYTVVLGNPYVVLNGSLDEYELRTVAAHELGHHIFHGYLAEAGPIQEIGFYNVKSGPEYEANVFAAELLIDTDELLLLLSEESDFYSVASMLNVSPELLAFKMKNSGGIFLNYNIPIIARSDFMSKRTN